MADPLNIAKRLDDPLRVAVVLWNGAVGGAETLSASLAARMPTLGVEAKVFFIGEPDPMAARLAAAGVSFHSLGLERGRHLTRHRRRYAAEVCEVGPDGALLVSRGLMGTMLRSGGYGGAIVAVEHGSLLREAQEYTGVRRPLRRLSRTTSSMIASTEVAVSEFMLRRMRQHAHSRHLCRIYNGIDTKIYSPGTCNASSCTPLVAGVAGRLIAGKGIDVLIRAVVEVNKRFPLVLLIAGDGPERARLEGLARESGVSSSVFFMGMVNDVPAFWRNCHVAVVPPDRSLIESFSMTTLEAMACGKAIVATRNGGIPELVKEDVTGTLVPPGDSFALAKGLIRYAEDEGLRLAHAQAARARASEMFDLDRCTREYVTLFRRLVSSTHQ